METLILNESETLAFNIDRFPVPTNLMFEAFEFGTCKPVNTFPEYQNDEDPGEPDYWDYSDHLRMEELRDNAEEN